MQLGIFAKTFAGSEALPVLAAIRESGFATTQFNLACVGLPSMPDAVPPEAIATIRAASRDTGISLAALSGTYNMAHPDKSARDKGLQQLRVVIETAAALEIPLVTLCTGTRNAEDQWAHHPDNADPSAWRDMAVEIEKALEIFERRPMTFDPDQIGMAGVFVSIDSDGSLLVERGYVRAEDETPAEPEAEIIDPETGEVIQRAIA